MYLCKLHFICALMRVKEIKHVQCYLHVLFLCKILYNNFASDNDCCFYEFFYVKIYVLHFTFFLSEVHNVKESNNFRLEYSAFR